MRVVWIMSAYNSERTVESAIRSIQAQSYTDWELVVVDDGSEDATPGILSQLSDIEPRMHVLRNERNVGLATALNRAWQHRPADVYVRADADDTCHPDRLARQVDYLQQHREVAVLGSAALLVNDQEQVLGCLRRPEMHEHLVSRILRENPFVHPTVAMRGSFLTETRGYDPQLLRAQDYDLWLRGYKGWRFHNLPDPLLRYRMRAVPSWSSIYWGTRMLFRAVWRDHRYASAYWYPLRFLAAATLMHLRLLGHPTCRESASTFHL